MSYAQQVGEIQSVGDGGFASPAVHSQFAAAAAMEPPQPSISEHASVGDAFAGGDMDAVRLCLHSCIKLKHLPDPSAAYPDHVHRCNQAQHGRRNLRPAPKHLESSKLSMARARLLARHSLTLLR